MRRELLRNIVILLAIILILSFIAFSSFFQSIDGKTSLYFNAKSDLPGILTPIFIEETNSTKEVNMLYIGQEYDIMFTIGNNKKTKTDYKLEIDSGIYELEQDLTLEPDEIKKFSLNIKTNESQKWRVNHSLSKEWKNEIDITRNSWLAEKDEFQILVREDGLPILIEENYNLPISTEVGPLGEIYHIELSIDELRKEPFSQTFNFIDSGELEKTETNEIINLYVKDDKLILEATAITTRYISEEDEFAITIYEEGKDPIIEQKTNTEIPLKISFMYLVK